MHVKNYKAMEHSHWWDCRLLTLRLEWIRGSARGCEGGGERHHSADFLLWGRCDSVETLCMHHPPPSSTLTENLRHKWMPMLLSCPPLAKWLIPWLDSLTSQYGLQWLAGLGCSEDAGFWRFSLLHFSGCPYRSWLSGKTCLSAASAII